jgi:hypothetical protein
LVALAAVVVAVGCGNDEAASTTMGRTATTATSPTEASPTEASTTTSQAAVGSEGCADVIDATIERGAAGFTVSATVSSADEGWDKYADAWVVRTPDGTKLGERILTHPHENEQPFTRSLSGVEIPPDISQVVVAARDTVVGFCGAEFVAEVPHS